MQQIVFFLAANPTNVRAVYVDPSLKEGNAVGKEALKLISDGLEAKLFSVLQALLSATHPVEMVCLSSCFLLPNLYHFIEQGSEMHQLSAQAQSRLHHFKSIC